MGNDLISGERNAALVNTFELRGFVGFSDSINEVRCKGLYSLRINELAELFESSMNVLRRPFQHHGAGRSGKHQPITN